MSAQTDLFTDVTSAVVEALEVEQQSHWWIGDNLAKLPATKGVDKAIASEVGKSASWVSEHRKTAAAFEPDQRAADMSWQIHVMAARTSEPVVWLEYAIENQCSTRELKDKLSEAGEIKTRDKNPEATKCPHCGGEL